MDALTLVLALMGAAALAGAGVAARRVARTGSLRGCSTRARRTSLTWAAAFTLLLTGVTVWAACAHEPGVALPFAAFAVLCAAGLVLQMSKHRAPLPAGRIARGALKAVMLALVALLAMLALELPSNDLLLSGGMSPVGLGIEFALLLTAVCAGYFLFQRTGAGPAAVTAVCAGFGIAEHFVLLYKGQPITFGDLLAVGTAATVSNGYAYALSASCFAGLACAAAAFALCSLAGLRPQAPGDAARLAGDKRAAQRCEGDKRGAPPLLADGRRVTLPGSASPCAKGLASPSAGAHFSPAVTQAARKRAVARASRIAAAAINLAGGAALCAAVVLGVARVSFIDDLGVSIVGWEMQNSYRQQGFLTAFVANLQLIAPHAPRGYSDAAADDFIETYAAAWDNAHADDASYQAAAQQFAEVKPTVIVVMNETFADLSMFDGLGCGYAGPAFFSNLPGALASGPLMVPAQGGGTCNTEFELLTGASTGFIGSGVYPYQSYNLSNVDNLARAFGGLGYATTALHPNLPTNWNRANAYEGLGFDRFLSIDDFAGAETVCGKVSDAATYDKILELLAQDEGPQFILDVTMQNHLPYNTGLMPAEDRNGYVSAAPEGAADDEVNEYLDLIDRSDEALQAFLEELAGLGRPVAVLFFGDHQPAFTRAYNDALMADADDLEHEARLWETRYAVWANYAVAGRASGAASEATSANYLGPRFLELIGAPLSAWDKARLAVAEEVPQVGTVGWRDAAGTLRAHVPGSAESGNGAYDALRAMQYRKLFRPRGDDSNVLAVTTQDQANV